MTFHNSIHSYPNNTLELVKMQDFFFIQNQTFILHHLSHQGNPYVLYVCVCIYTDI